MTQQHTSATCSCPADTHSPDGYAIFTPTADCPVHGVDWQQLDQMSTAQILSLEWNTAKRLRGTLMGQIAAAFDHDDTAHMNRCNRILDRLERIWFAG